jgi:hypothetical protein
MSTGESKEDVWTQEQIDTMNLMDTMNQENEKNAMWKEINDRYIKDLEKAKSRGETRKSGYPPTTLQILENEFSSTLNSEQKKLLNEFRRDASPSFDTFFDTLDPSQANIFYEWRKVYRGNEDKNQKKKETKKPKDNFDSFFNRIRQRAPMRVGFTVADRDDVEYNKTIKKMAKFTQSVKEHQLRLWHIAETKKFLGEEDKPYVELDLTEMGIGDLQIMEEEAWEGRDKIEAEENRLNEKIQEIRMEELEKILEINKTLDKQTLIKLFQERTHVLSLPAWKKDIVSDSKSLSKKDSLANEFRYHLPRNGLYQEEERMINNFFKQRLRSKSGGGSKKQKNRVRRTRRKNKKSRQSKRRHRQSKRRPGKSKRRPRQSKKLPKKHR